MNAFLIDRFVWTDRNACIRRAYVLHSCLEGVTVEESARRALWTPRGPQEGLAGFRYCLNPDLIPEATFKALLHDMECYNSYSFTILERQKQTHEQLKLQV